MPVKVFFTVQIFRNYFFLFYVYIDSFKLIYHVERQQRNLLEAYMDF